MGIGVGFAIVSCFMLIILGNQQGILALAYKTQPLKLASIEVE